MNLPHLRQLLLSSQSLMMVEEVLRSQLMQCLAPISSPSLTPAAFFFDDPETYAQESSKAFKELMASLKTGMDKDLPPVTMDYTSAEVPDGSIAYHRIAGTITFDSRWYFSTRRFEQDLLAAEQNPAIIAHLLHINSGGGEAYYLDRLSETMRSLTKPVVVLIEQYCASAAYYIGCHSSHIYALTANDTIGCVGTMVHVENWDGFYEKNGIRQFVIKSSLSPLKNKMYDDVMDGKPKEYIERVLDPLAAQFIAEVRSSRKALSGLSDDDRLLQGDTFQTAQAIERGIIDGTMTLSEALRQAQTLGLSTRKANSFALSL